MAGIVLPDRAKARARANISPELRSYGNLGTAQRGADFVSIVKLNKAHAIPVGFQTVMTWRRHAEDFALKHFVAGYEGSYFDIDARTFVPPRALRIFPPPHGTTSVSEIQRASGGWQTGGCNNVEKGTRRCK